MTHNTAEMVTILVADDDDGHAELICEHLREAGLRNPLRRFRDGQEVWSFLENALQNRQDGESPPWLLLLDIRMPRLDGVEVLRRIRAESWLSSMPVMMLTTTDDPREIEECYRLGCNCYITKPVDFLRFAETLRRLGLFLQIIRVPA